MQNGKENIIINRNDKSDFKGILSILPNFYFLNNLINWLMFCNRT